MQEGRTAGRPDEGAFRLLFAVMAVFAPANTGAALSMSGARHPDAQPGPVLKPEAADRELTPRAHGRPG